MDRNTLLAFFLIALVLLFTPKYMEIFAPQPATVESAAPENQDENKPATPPTTKTQAPQPEKPNKTGPIDNKHETKTTNIETDLFTAKVSSVNGGSIQSFLLKDFLTADSLEVNTISRSKKNNLEIEIKDLNGDPVPLNGNWKLNQEPGRTNLRLNKTLEYSLEVFKDKFIKKSLSFSPDNYTVEINLDFSEIKDLIYRDVRFSWKGGLSSTEKDSVDDKTYFKVAVYQGKEVEELKVKEGKSETKKLNGTTDWGAIRTKYFISAIIPKSPESIRFVEISGKSTNQERYDLSFVFDCFQETSFTLYHGPLEYEKIKSLGVDLDEIMDFGWSFIRPISKGVLYSLTRMHDYIPNYGVVLIVFSLLVKILVYPLTKKSYQSTSAMQEIQPEVNNLREKFKNNPQKLNQATMQLYKTKGVNPLGGCLPMLLQMPLLFALFQVFRTTIELRNEPFIWWIKDLSAPDVIINLPFSIPLYGDHIAFLPILMALSTYVQQKMMSGGIQQPQQKMMQNVMMVFFFLIFNNFPSGLNLYYTLFNVLTIAQQKLIPNKPKT
tara:strand:+ start:1612 stop:3264 length:1653 start_codon:yes stop_codon:yes gene_type:complete